MAKARTAVAELDLPCQFSNVNVGDEIASLSITVPRTALTISQADSKVCGKRLTGHILARGGGGQADQASLPGADNDVEIPGQFDVKSVTFTRKNVKFKLSFSIGSIDIGDLAHFAKREGRCVINVITALPERKTKKDQDEVE
jgi:hypothetical protein